MYLNVILTILVLVLVGISTLIVFWWKKYGKELFSLLINIKNVGSKTPTQETLPNLNSLFSDIEILSKTFSKFEKNKNYKNGNN